MRYVYFLYRKKSKDPSKVSRSEVWIAGHTRADGRPVKSQFAETIVRILELFILYIINVL